MELIDLHTHTTASDGSLSPRELVAAAIKAGLKAVAVTDHDTTSGLEEALGAGKEPGFEVVPGVEISVELAGYQFGLHMLGLYIDPQHAGLKAGLGRLQEGRADRNPQIAARLQELGVDITYDEVASQAAGGLVGRPHFAQVLVKKGVVSDTGEAFGRFLANEAPAYVPKFRLAAAEAMALLREAGGVPVLAHPGLVKAGFGELEEIVTVLKGQGLEGIEAYYTDHDKATRLRLENLAAKLGLVVSGGSDFHGAPKPDVALGRGKGDLAAPASLLTGIKQRRDRIRSEH